MGKGILIVHDQARAIKMRREHSCAQQQPGYVSTMTRLCFQRECLFILPILVLYNYKRISWQSLFGGRPIMSGEIDRSMSAVPPCK